MNRIEVLDYLRGLMAFSVMLYHYLTWSSGVHFSGEALLGKLGIYAVSIFFILSGLSLGMIYKSRICNFGDIRLYATKRFFRIAPLLWFVTFLTLLLIFIGSFLGIDSRNVSFQDIILNFSLLFGFIDTSSYIASGAWSIGNELVFYAILPFVLILNKHYKYTILLSTLLSFFIYIYFAFNIIDVNSLFETNWSLYINPFNQLFLFMSGVLMGYYRSVLKNIVKINNSYSIILVVLLIGLFYFYPVNGDRILLITGWNRIVLTFICILIVFLLMINSNLYEYKNLKFLSYMGLISYSVYLIHPLVYYPVSFLGKKLHVSSDIVIFIAIILTFFTSKYIYKHIELPFMRKKDG